MFTRSLARRVLAPVLAGALFCASLGFAQSGLTSQSDPDAAKITVAIDGLVCTASSQGSFEASGFQIVVDDSAGNAGGGAGKVTFGDLVIQKPSDGCTLPLFILAAKCLPIKRIVLNELGKNNKSILTLTLQNIIIASSQIKGAEVSQNAREMLDLSYADLTIADASGNVVARILR